MTGTLTETGVRARSGWALMVLLGLTVACGGEEVGRTVDAGVTLDLPESIALGSPLDIGYTWAPSDGFEAPADDFRVFVHIVDPDGNMVGQDDYFPEVPTSQWRAGQPFTERHLLYLDPDLRVDYLDFYVGLYDDEGQVGTLRGGRFRNRPLVHTVIVRTDDQGGLPVYVEGFAEKEMSLTSDDINVREWQWMGRQGLVAFGNPRGPATLHVRARSPVDFLGGTQTVTIKIGELEIARYERIDSSPYLLRFDVPGEGLGDGDWIDFTIEVDNFFVPAQVEERSTDTRELGLQVFWMYLAR